MPRDRTPEEDVPLSVRAKRLVGMGRGKDIELPLGSRGRRDPRLERPDVGKAFESAGKGLSKVRELTRRR